MESRQPDNNPGLEIMLGETRLLEERIKKVSSYASSKIEGYSQPEISVYLYGSPSRREMIGGDGDADVFILEREKTSMGREFREVFTREMGKFDYSKLDLPEWGTLSEVEIFLDRSLVEGNQVLETRFVWGNDQLDLELRQLKVKYNSLDRAIKNFIFNRLYLDEYFKRKTRANAVNVKYCHGGSRELLFLSWYKDIIDFFTAQEVRPSQYPRCFEGAKVALERGEITQEEYNQFIKAADYLTVFRTDILRVNKQTKDRGLSFLDAETIRRLRREGYPCKDEILRKFEENRKIIRSVAEKVYGGVISIGASLKGSTWGEDMKMLKSLRVSEKELVEARDEDPVIVISKLWTANNLGMKNYFLRLAERYKNTRDWAIIGTIVNSNFCPASLLDEYGRGICKERGYGYLLRVIARNPNTLKDTLKSIAEDQSLEDRYTVIARAALANGVEGTKNQI